jgi:DNA-binding Lrp family transcriptional regulator
MLHNVIKQKKRPVSKSAFYYPVSSPLPDIYYNESIRKKVPIKLSVHERQYVCLMNKRLSKVSPFAKERTWKTALKNGHTDTEVFSYVNNFKKVLRATKHGNTVTEYESCDVIQNLVLDIDNALFYGPESFVKFLEWHNLPVPSIISQTSIDSFHFVYRFKLEDPSKGLTQKDALYLALMLTKKPFNESEPGNTAEDNINGLEGNYFTIDKSYIKQHPSNHKFRVPGTPKIKHGKDVFVCRGWASDRPRFVSQHELRVAAGCYEVFGPVYKSEFHWSDGSYISGLEDICINNTTTTVNETKKYTKLEAPAVVKLAKKVFKENDFWKNHIIDFQEEIQKVLPKRYASKYANWLAQNLTFLKQGKCAISQVRLAEELGITQVTVSKHLKLLVEAEVLWTNNFYIKNKSPKTYRLGFVMINRIYTIDTSYDIGKEYESGTTNEQFMNDIRYLRSSGIEKEEVVTLITIKMDKKPKSKQRRTRDIEKAVDRWDEICKYKKPSMPLIGFEEINRKVIGLEYGKQIFRFPDRDRIRTEGI